jgi:RNA polymerase sigma-70 factor (ECF subfamily)
MDPPTAELVRRAAAGDDAAGRAVDEHLRPALHALLRRRVPCRHDREDVVQQTLLQLHRQAQRLEAGRPVLPYAARVALRRAIDQHRREARRPAVAWPEGGVASEDASAGPQRAAADRELRDNLWATAEATLPARQYELLWLRFGEGLDPPEVAASLGLTNVHVRVLQHRAIKKLRAVLGPRGDAAGRKSNVAAMPTAAAAEMTP